VAYPHGVSSATRRRPRLGSALTLLVTVGVLAALLTGCQPPPIVPPPAVHPDPAGYTTTGIDTSKWQHPNGQAVDWNAVRNSGVSFAFMKATDGPTYVDPWFATDWAAAGRAGLYRGAYMFAEPSLPTTNALTDAQHFAATIGPVGLRDLPPVLDLESTGGLDATQLSDWTATWLNEVTRLTGRTPIIYTGYYFWRGNLADTTRFSRYPLWYARYNLDPVPGPLFGGWSRWSFWQWSSTGAVPGIAGNVDLDRFAGSLDDLSRLTPDPATRVPFGALDRVNAGFGMINATGWAIDPDTASPILVDTYVDGQWRSTASANLARPDVEAVHPGWGNQHGFTTTIGAAVGTHLVCSYGINIAAGPTNTLLGCMTVILGGNPIGSNESVTFTAPGTITSTGWAVDLDTTSPIVVDTYIDGRWRSSVMANGARPDIEALHPGFGPNHGYHADVTGMTTGTHQVCTYAINVGPGNANTGLGCQSITLTGNPIGRQETATAGGPGAIVATGWALDPDTTGPIAVDTYVDGHFAATTLAASPRSDLAVPYPGAGELHGFTVTVAGLTAGTHQICSYAINTGSGSANPGIGCATVSIGGNPIGDITGSTRSGTTADITGWAIDPDTASPITVDTYVDGRYAASTVASLSRPDIGPLHPGFGPNHGFDVPLSGLTVGSHQVCVYAINTGAGSSNPVLGCLTI
jgi:GH25 family lysozyme M1 (1,4-beta-N-acetylmuramidase)